MTHTPGPWTANDFLILDADGHQIAEVWGDVDHDHGNVALITAVPNLLEACEAFVEAWEKSCQLEKTDVALRMAKAAIEKATPPAEVAERTE